MGREGNEGRRGRGGGKGNKEEGRGGEKRGEEGCPVFLLSRPGNPIHGHFLDCSIPEM